VIREMVLRSGSHGNGAVRGGKGVEARATLAACRGKGLDRSCEWRPRGTFGRCGFGR
jgi:N-methylhydantoinase B/oxoprolinase/acetone carboxylase alpha subunit